MPELPEVETTKTGIAPHVEGKRCLDVVVRERRLRWPITPGITAKLKGKVCQSVQRRGKYIVWNFGEGHILLHLGMSGSLRVLEKRLEPGKHDHVDLHFSGGKIIRFRDPRRFGCLLWTADSPEKHRLLAALGPEPLGEDFTAEYFCASAKNRTLAIKTHIMNSKVVVGVGNIYASEALFRAGIHPSRAAKRISRPRLRTLRLAIREVLEEAITQGGTTLKDFSGTDGEPGYFAVRLAVYGKNGEPCPVCGKPIKHLVQGGRSTYYCSACQH